MILMPMQTQEPYQLSQQMPANAKLLKQIHHIKKAYDYGENNKWYKSP